MPNKKVKEKVAQEGFVFDKVNHLYYLDGIPLIGTTTVLKVISKPQLIQWAADETAKFLGWFNEKYDDGTGAELGAKRFAELIVLTPEAYQEALGEARVAHRRKKEAGGDIGKSVHQMIEDWVRLAIVASEGYLTGKLPIVENDAEAKMLANFWNWASENKVKFLESEKKVYSRTHWFAGTLDLIFEMDGKIFVGDVKTASNIYNENFYQMAAYDICLREMGGQKIDGYLVINLKKDGTMDLKMTENLEINKQAFLHALELHKIINSME